MTRISSASKEGRPDPLERVFGDVDVRDLPVSEIRSRIDAYRASVGKATTAQAGFFRKPSPECHEAVGMPPLVSHEEVEKMLDDALKA